MEHNDTVTGEVGQVPAAVREPAATYAAGSGAGHGYVNAANGGRDTLLHDAPEVVSGRNGGRLTPIRTSERAREMVAAREAKKARAIRSGVAKASLQVAGVAHADPYALIEAAAENHALNALDPSAPGSTRSYDLILKHGWPMPERSHQVTDARTVAAAAVGAELAQALLAELRELRAGRG